MHTCALCDCEYEYKCLQDWKLLFYCDCFPLYVHVLGTPWFEIHVITRQFNSCYTSVLTTWPQLVGFIPNVEELTYALLLPAFKVRGSVSDNKLVQYERGFDISEVRC